MKTHDCVCFSPANDVNAEALATKPACQKVDSFSISRTSFNLDSEKKVPMRYLSSLTREKFDLDS